MWDAAGFPFCMRDKSSAKLPYNVIIEPPLFFNAIKIVLYQLPYAVLTAYFLKEGVGANRKGHMIFPKLLCRAFLHSFPSLPASRLAYCEESLTYWP